MARSASVRFDSRDQQRLDELGALTVSDPSRLARFAIADALERMHAHGKSAAVELVAAYRFEEPSTERRLLRITVDDEFQRYIDLALQAVAAHTHIELTPSKIVCAAMIVWMRRSTDELRQEIGSPFASLGDRGYERLRSAS